MKVIFGNYKVKSTHSGWMLQKKCGKQWKKTQYFDSLEGLVDTLLQQTFNDRTSKQTYYLSEEDDAVFMLDRISQELKVIRNEIVGVLHG